MQCNAKIISQGPSTENSFSSHQEKKQELSGIVVDKRSFREILWINVPLPFTSI